MLQRSAKGVGESIAVDQLREAVKYLWGIPKPPEDAVAAAVLDHRAGIVREAIAKDLHLG